MHVLLCGLFLSPVAGWRLRPCGAHELVWAIGVGSWGSKSDRIPTWYNLPWSEKIVMCLSKPALPVEGVFR